MLILECSKWNGSGKDDLCLLSNYSMQVETQIDSYIFPIVTNNSTEDSDTISILTNKWNNNTEDADLQWTYDFMVISSLFFFLNSVKSETCNLGWGRKIRKPSCSWLVG